MRKKISIIYVLQKNRANKEGFCPLYARITYLGKRKEFSTGFSIKPENWNRKLKRTLKSRTINHNLESLEYEIKKAHLYLEVNESSFDVYDIYLKYKGEPSKKQRTVLDMFEIHNKRMKALIGKEYSKATYGKFEESKMHTRNFIKSVYNKNDYLLDNLTLKFLNDFDFYLKDSMNHKQITINKTLQRVRKIVKLAVGEGFLDRDPFLLYKSKKVVRNIVYLTPEELKKLENYEFSQKRLQQVKDLFILCCYTGLAYKEMASFKNEHIVKWKDDSLWIEMIRKKTKSNISIPLLPKAIQILEKYQFILPKISNQKFNSYLKEISEVIGIRKRLTHHTARKTFATSVLLYNNIPMEIVSKLLGHSKMQTTRKYYTEISKDFILKALNF